MRIHKFWVLFSVTMFNLTVKKSQHADSCIWVQLVWVYVKHISTQLYIRVKRPHWNTCIYRRTLAYQHDYSHRLLVVAIIWLSNVTSILLHFIFDCYLQVSNVTPILLHFINVVSLHILTEIFTIIHQNNITVILNMNFISNPSRCICVLHETNDFNKSHM